MTEHTDYLFFNARTTLLEEIAKRMGMTNENIVMLDFNEIESIIKNNFLVDKEILEKIVERKKGFAIIWDDTKVKVFFGKDALFLQEMASINIIEKKEEEKIDTIKGDVANCGKIQGIVKILNSYEDIYKVNKGDIIVTTMTTPDFVAAMEKAAGFITDEGGITCHAAIISREFDVPCIVGTINATEKLKDGQLIEMNAYTGIIKVLK